jgi:hypothetical protein
MSCIFLGEEGFLQDGAHACIKQRRMTGRYMKIKLETIWKEAVLL